MSTSSSSLSYPPAARTHTRGSIIDKQPQNASVMSLDVISRRTGHRQPQKEGPAQRIRGGCVPCPVRTRLLLRSNGVLIFNVGRRILFHHTTPVLLSDSWESIPAYVASYPTHIGSNLALDVQASRRVLMDIFDNPVSCSILHAMTISYNYLAALLLSLLDKYAYDYRT